MDKPKILIVTDKRPRVEKKLEVAKDKKLPFRAEITCYTCGKKSHTSMFCKDKKEIKTIKVEN
jgi:hypothetical protein